MSTIWRDRVTLKISEEDFCDTCCPWATAGTCMHGTLPEEERHPCCPILTDAPETIMDKVKTAHGKLMKKAEEWQNVSKECTPAKTDWVDATAKSIAFVESAQILMDICE